MANPGSLSIIVLTVPRVFLKTYFYVSMNEFASVYVYTPHFFQCPWKSEEGFVSPTEGRDCVSCDVGPGTST